MNNYTFIDTDLQIHRLSPNPAVQKAAEYEFANSHPTALSAFSLVELKGNYISCLILLLRKVSDSDSFNRAYARIDKAGGRKAKLMLAQLIKWLGGINFPINPWGEARRILITHLEAQITASWEEFRNSTDTIFDDFNCSRAGESPQQIGDNWSTTIPHELLSNVV